MARQQKFMLDIAHSMISNRIALLIPADGLTKHYATTSTPKVTARATKVF